MEELIHLTESLGVDDFDEVWCGEACALKSSLDMHEVTCKECLVEFSNEGEVAKERLWTLNRQINDAQN